MGDLPVAESFEITEHYDFTKHFRQTGNCQTNLFADHVALKMILRALSLIGQPWLQRTAVDSTFSQQNKRSGPLARRRHSMIQTLRRGVNSHTLGLLCNGGVGHSFDSAETGLLD